MVEVNFIVMDAYSPYTAIVARPWLHALRAISFTLHLKVKYPSKDQIEGLIAIKDFDVIHGCRIRRGKV